MLSNNAILIIVHIAGFICRAQAVFVEKHRLFLQTSALWVLPYLTNTKIRRVYHMVSLHNNHLPPARSDFNMNDEE